MLPSIPIIKTYLLDLQNCIIEALHDVDRDLKIQQDRWQHHSGGGGITGALAGPVIEKAGVNFSHVKGTKLPQGLLTQRPELSGYEFEALGVSVVTHPQNPYAPTAHLNVRFFCASKLDAAPVWWFGGGYDLTPYYGFEADCMHWHQTAKNACEPFGPDVYANYKRNCDNYFYLVHRQEPRGVGGLFFDNLNNWGFARCFDFMQAVGNSFIHAYQPLLNTRKHMAYGKREKDFQKYRRGRYVEFNLVYDRGTLFGLQSGGRTESILISMPPEVIWRYDMQISAGSAEAELTEKFLCNRAWV